MKPNTFLGNSYYDLILLKSQQFSLSSKLKPCRELRFTVQWKLPLFCFIFWHSNLPFHATQFQVNLLQLDLEVFYSQGCTTECFCDTLPANRPLHLSWALSVDFPILLQLLVWAAMTLLSLGATSTFSALWSLGSYDLHLFSLQRPGFLHTWYLRSPSSSKGQDFFILGSFSLCWATRRVYTFALDILVFRFQILPRTCLWPWASHVAPWTTCLYA